MESEGYLDIKTLNPEKIVSYHKLVVNGESRKKYIQVGHLTDDGTGYYKYCSYNKFSDQILPIPLSEDGWINNFERMRHEYDEDHDEETFEEYLELSKKSFARWVDNHICNPNVKHFAPKKEGLDKYKNCDLYKTLDNYSIGFIVLINRENNETHVYGITRDVLPDDYNGDEIVLFDRLIVKYKPSEIFVGKSIFNEMTDFSGGYGEVWDGNSILLRIGHFNEYRYIYIGTEVFEFVVDEKITRYTSSVGNNCVPYPYAESKNWVYDMLRCQKFPVSDNMNRAVKGHVFDSENANAQDINVTNIARRGTEDVKSSINCDKPMIYITTGPFELCENTCANEELPLVQHVNKAMSENIYCASLQDQLPAPTVPATYGYGCIIF
uniref:Uncharacterized protein n=1 Tax=viral metagenome TaxID=1070528 RepID=A0A6C0C6X1_9ZZZZ